MLKNFKLPALALGAAMAIISPGAALAERYDRDHERHEWREHARHERREHVWSERAPGLRYRYGIYGSAYANGYYDRWGRWHPFGYGFYDRWGRWHPY
jgi:hypothetical protein